jgi:hypothetical protein
LLGGAVLVATVAFFAVNKVPPWFKTSDDEDEDDDEDEESRPTPSYIPAFLRDSPFTSFASSRFKKPETRNEQPETGRS